MHSTAIRRFAPFFLIVAFLFALTPAAPVFAQTTPTAVISPLDLADMDQSVDPGEDFYRFVVGGWLDRTEIPPDWPSYGVTEEVYDRTEQQLLALLTGVEVDEADAELSDQEKAALLFQQGLDIEARNAQGLEPLQPVLDRIDAVATLDDLHALWLDPEMITFPDLINLQLTPDPADTTMNVLWLAGPFLGLPAVEYYTDDDASMDSAREAYVTLVKDLLVAIGYAEAGAQTAAEAVYAFEESLATHMVTAEEAQDFAVLYNPVTAADLATTYPMLDWDAYLEARNVAGSPTIINSELRLLNELDALINAADLDAIKDYLKMRAVIGSYDLLGEDLEAAVFPYIQALFGVEEQAPTEEEVLGVVNFALGDAVGQLYVAEHFPPESKAQITEIAENVIDAFRARLEANTWMSEETKAAAFEKLDAMVLKLGYPDTWKSYETVEVGDSYFETASNAQRAEFLRQMTQAGQPVDRAQWPAPPQTVNAGYQPDINAMVFFAGFLQPPFFDPNADDAWNYGAIGATIGHELTHGFDLQGSQFDASGNFVNWWAEEDAAAFDELNQKVVAQYGAIEVLPDLFINGQLTVTENVADMGGLQSAFDALQAVLAEEGDPGLIDGFTPNQRFFIAFATSWRETLRDEYLTTLIQSNEHAPGRARAVVPAQNMDAFYEAFEIEPGDALYLAPEERVVIW